MSISVLIPSIRLHLLRWVHESIAASFHGAWEMVVVSPFPLPESLQGKGNVVYLHDRGNPIRCRQRALLAARGDWICYAADDVLFCPRALDLAFEKVNGTENTALAGKYIERGEGNDFNPLMRSDEYYLLKTHDFLRPVMAKVPGGDGYRLLNTGLIPRRLLLDIGGFNCVYEACAMACVDLSIRLQNLGVKIVLQDEPLFEATHLNGPVGDHGPVHDAQTDHDMPLFLQLWGNGVGRNRVELDNWQRADDWWTRRWGPKPKEAV